MDGGQVTRRRVRRIEMVGRDREKAQLLEAMSAAKNNEFSAVWIQGEAGYGKSLLSVTVLLRLN